MPGMVMSGEVTYETCPQCGERGVMVEHGFAIRPIDDDGEQVEVTDIPAAYWHCPVCGGYIVAVRRPTPAAPDGSNEPPVS